jgi:GrpB-like predicted nucleotidyltransferase (UPF0157 family)
MTEQQVLIGLEKGVVRLASHNVDWARVYEGERARIEAAIGAHILEVQHVGSTSIPGLAAKPIIDIAVGVEDFEVARVCIAPLEALGYTYHGENGISGRHYFTRGDPTLYHTHMHEVTSRAWGNLVLFRDYLLQHPKEVRAYLALKRRLAEQHRHDRRAYTEGKAAFIERILRLARGELKPPDAEAMSFTHKSGLNE